MALHWNLTDIKNLKDVCWVNEGDERSLNPITEAIIWSTIVVQIGKITEKNVDEWVWRLYYTSKLGRGKLIPDTDRYRNPTRDELMLHIGLSTNVSTISRREFCSRIASSLKQDADWYTAKN